jgi:tight adherence protein C
MLGLPLVPLAAAFATAGGLGLAVLVFVLARPAAATGSEDPAPAGVLAAPRAARTSGVGRVLPAPYRRMLERQLLLAGRPDTWTLPRMVVLKPLLALVVGLLAFWWISLGPAPFKVGVGLFAVLLAFFLPDLLVYSRGIERQQQIQIELPDTLDQMTISVEAGLGFESAMAKAATNGNGPLAEELIRTLQDMSIGRSRHDAYEALAARTTSTDLRRFTRAVIQADTYGIAIADVLHVQASEMRLKRRQRAEEKAMKVPVKVLFPLMFCILPVLFIVILAPAAINALKAFGLGF